MDSGNNVLRWRVYYWAKPHKAVQVKTESDTPAGIRRGLFDAGVPTPTSTSATIVRRGADFPDGSSRNSKAKNA